MLTRFFSMFKRSSSLQFNVIPKHIHKINVNQIDKSAISVIRKLQSEGFLAFIVGGAVRDLLLGFLPKDFDIATNATPSQIKKCFRRAFIIGRRFKIVHVHQNNKIIEVSTFRAKSKTKSKYIGKHGRILADNIYGTQLEDANRRDFTVNAFYFNPIDNTVFDAHNGIDDILQKKLRVIGKVDKRFQEDPVRILRILRFIAKLDFSIDDEITKSIKKHLHLLNEVPNARLADEFRKFLVNGYASRGINILAKWNLLDFFIIPININNNTNIYQSMIQMVLSKADQRFNNNQLISQPFIISVMLWGNLVDKYSQLNRLIVNNFVRFQMSIKEIIHAQQEKIFLTRLNCYEVKEIWLLQQKLLSPRLKNINKLLNHRRISAGIDFLELRSEIVFRTIQNLSNNKKSEKVFIDTQFLHETPKECLYWANWWRDYLAADNHQRQEMKLNWEKTLISANHPRKKQLHKKKSKYLKINK